MTENQYPYWKELVDNMSGSAVGVYVGSIPESELDAVDRDLRALIFEILEALEDLANECEEWVDAEYKDDGEVYHPALQRKYDRDMETVLKARALIAKARGETDVT